MENWHFEVEHISALDEVAKKVVELSEDCNIVLLKGEMGTGKTTLSKNICKLLNVIDEVSSPTFSLINEYETQDGKKVYHFDLYRLESLEEAFDIGAEDYFNSNDLCLIEWPRIAEEIIPEGRIEVHIELKGIKRTFNISKYHNVR